MSSFAQIWLPALNNLYQVFGEPATYRTAGGIVTPVSVIADKAVDSDRLNTFLFVNIRQSEIQNPAEGDQLTIGPTTYSIFKVEPGAPDSGETKCRIKKRA